MGHFQVLKLYIEWCMSKNQHWNSSDVVCKEPVYIYNYVIFNTAAQTHIISIPCLSTNRAGTLSTRASLSKLHRPTIGSQNVVVLCRGTTQV